MKHTSLVMSVLLLLGVCLPGQTDSKPRFLKQALDISSHQIMADIEELCLDKYAGRLTGTPEYNLAAEWLAARLSEAGVKPVLDRRYFQDYPNPYTRVLDEGSLILHIPVSDGQFIDRPYQFETEYVPGSTSATGKIRGDVVYVGYGVSAKELGYDDYKGMDVKGKIVLMEREVPVSPEENAALFSQWRPYSFHSYKVENARQHGAAGMLYNYHIANPNCRYFPDFLLTYVGGRVVTDLFMGTGRNHETVVQKIAQTLKPQSFDTGKRVTLSNRTEFHAEGVGRNVIGIIPGTDPKLGVEVIALGGHLDHLGMGPRLLPGANDNASAVAVMLAVARAIHQTGCHPRRSVLFLFFGAEEQGVAGSEYYIKNPVLPNDQIKAFFNMDGVGRGDSLYVLAGRNFSRLAAMLDGVNDKWVHRPLKMTSFHNLARPRLDAAHFLWAGVPTVSFSAFGLAELPEPVYHRSTDRPELLTPEIMEDLARLLFLAIMESDASLG